MGNKTTPKKARNGLIVALDVGTTKSCCFIARLGSDREIHIVGAGHKVSQGLRSGAIVDMEGAESSIRATVEAAEKMAGENIHQVIVNLSGGSPASKLIAYEVPISGHEIGDADLQRIIDPSSLIAGLPRGREIIHAIPVGYTIDENRGVRDPRGMCGERLGVNMHIVTANSGAVRNLTNSITRCHLDIEAKVISPYASALACIVDDEAQLGVTHIDMGGGTTSIAVFFDGELVHTDTIPIGGEHVTKDIAKGLSTPVAYAERAKTLYGSAIPSSSDDREIIKVPLIGEIADSDSSQVPRSMMTGIIRPRLEETFEMVRSRIEEAGFDKVSGRRVVLTGGASQLSGAREMAALILDKQVRVGLPKHVEGLAESNSGPAFSTCLGLLKYGLDGSFENHNGTYRPPKEPNGRFGRFGQWFRGNF